MVEVGHRKIWGEHSLTIGEILAVAIGVALIFLKPFGRWSLWIGLVCIGLGMALF